MQLNPQLKELLLQALEHERGGELVYDTAISCAINEDLEEKWEDYLEQTERHVEILTEVCEALDIDPDEMTPGRRIVQHNGDAMVMAMKMAADGGDRAAAQLVACDCVMLAETRDHFNWELIGECARALAGVERAVLMKAYEQVQYDEEEHLYHSQDWCRELWLDSLGLEAVLPPRLETYGGGAPDDGEGADERNA
ncbi:MAG TPA: hypothetical protein VHP37_22415 [Burkholderiales bacterium]|nr:hypothetical protein [Burkholderiales bacterium]